MGYSGDMSVWKNVGQNLAGLTKHVVKSVVLEPMEVVKDLPAQAGAVGQKIEQGQSPFAQGATVGTGQGDTRSDPMTDLAKAGFRTQEDYQKYQGLSEKKDDLELSAIRAKLVREWGLDSDLESGMQKARMEWQQREDERKKVEEKKEEQKKEFEFQQKVAEDIGLKAAKAEASAENKAWGAG